MYSHVATQDEQANTIDLTISVVGDGALELLTTFGAQFGVTADDISADPSVPLKMTMPSGPSPVFHLSAHESDRARADAVLVAGAVGIDEIPAGHQPVHVDGDLMTAVKTASRIALTRIRDRSIARMPHAIREGLHRHDRSADPALSPAGEPAVGRQVKLQFNLRDGEGWFAMGGHVTRVLGPDSVEVNAWSTSDGAPKQFEGTWVAVLDRVAGWEYPWIVTSLSASGER